MKFSQWLDSWNEISLNELVNAFQKSPWSWMRPAFGIAQSCGSGPNLLAAFFLPGVMRSALLEPTVRTAKGCATAPTAPAASTFTGAACVSRASAGRSARAGCANPKTTACTASTGVPARKNTPSGEMQFLPKTEENRTFGCFPIKIRSILSCYRCGDTLQSNQLLWVHYFWQ